MRRRRGRSIRALVALSIVFAAVAGYVWAWSRPVDLRIECVPDDAQIQVNGGTAAQGKLIMTDVEPGTYAVSVTRNGFEPKQMKVEAKRFNGADVTVSLRAIPQRLTVLTDPKKATIEIVSGNECVARGRDGSVKADIPSGRLLVRVVAQGFNEYEHEIFLDKPTRLSVRLDPEGQLVHGVSLVDCAGAPKAVALTPDAREAWATILNGPPSIEVFEPRTGERLAEIDLGKYGAVEITFNKAGTRAYASQMETAKVFEIDVKTRKILRALDTESTWTKVVALSPDEETLYAANWSGDDVSVIDLKTGKLLRRLPVDDTPRGLWPSADGKVLWVASFGTGALEKIDLASGDKERVFTSHGALRHLVADEKRGLLYASDMAKDCVWVTEMKTGRTRKFAVVDEKPNTIDLSPDGRVLFISCRGENNSISYYIPGPEWGSILLFDTVTGDPLDAVIGGNQCTALDVSANGKLLVFSDFLDDRLRTYDIPPFKVLSAGGGGRFAAHKKDLVK